MKSDFSKRFLLKNHLLLVYYLEFDWSGWIVLIKSEILITTGIVWPVCSDKWKAQPLPLPYMVSCKWWQVLASVKEWFQGEGQCFCLSISTNGKLIMWTIFPWYFKVIIHQLHLHWLEHWLSTLVSVSEIFLKTKRKTYADSTSVGGPSHFLNSIALKEFCVLREDLVVGQASHLKLLELCSDVLYQFLVAKIPQMDQLLCLF